MAVNVIQVANEKAEIRPVVDDHRRTRGMKFKVEDGQRLRNTYSYQH